MNNLVSKIPKEKLKPGKLYKTVTLPMTPGQVCLYRVWDGTKWSMGTMVPRHKNWALYHTIAGSSTQQQQIIVVNKVATPFKPEPPVNTSQTFTFKSAFVKATSKPLRYLNRP